MNTLYIVLSILTLLIILGHLIRSRRAKKKVLQVIDNNCTGCQRCIKICRHKTLEMVQDEKGLHVAIKFPEKCTSCGNCVAACKFNALELVNRKQPEWQPS